jgi:hypothetical protein
MTIHNAKEAMEHLDRILADIETEEEVLEFIIANSSSLQHMGDELVLKAQQKGGHRKTFPIEDLLLTAIRVHVKHINFLRISITALTAGDLSPHDTALQIAEMMRIDDEEPPVENEHAEEDLDETPEPEYPH